MKKNLLGIIFFCCLVSFSRATQDISIPAKQDDEGSQHLVYQNHLQGPREQEEKPGMIEREINKLEGNAIMKKGEGGKAYGRGDVIKRRSNKSGGSSLMSRKDYSVDFSSSICLVQIIISLILSFIFFPFPA